MEILHPMEDVDLDLEPAKFGIRHKLARMVIGLDSQTAADRYGLVGYKAGGLHRNQITAWEKGDIGKVTRYMTKGASLITGQPEAFFLGERPLDDSVIDPFLEGFESWRRGACPEGEFMELLEGCVGGGDGRIRTAE